MFKIPSCLLLGKREERRAASLQNRCEELSERLESYSIKGRLGRGAFGEVLLAETPTFGKKRLVALKAIKRARLVKDSTKALALAEVNNLKHMSSTGSMLFMQLYEAFYDVHNFYIVTDFLCGGTLRDEIVLAKGKLCDDRLVLIMAQLVQVIHELRRERVIHRDIKPENILLDALGNITLADFGMSRRFDIKESQVVTVDGIAIEFETTDNAYFLTNTGCGTLAYAAPEMHRKESYSFPVDVYSLGVVFYELLFNCLPYPQRDLRELRKAVCEEKWSVPPGHSKVDPVTLDLCEKLLSSQPSERIGVHELRAHNFFAHVDWPTLAAHAYDLPIRYAPALNIPDMSHTVNLGILIDPEAVVEDGPADRALNNAYCIAPTKSFAARPSDPRTWGRRVDHFVSCAVDAFGGTLRGKGKFANREGKVYKRNWMRDMKSIRRGPSVEFRAERNTSVEVKDGSANSRMGSSSLSTSISSIVVEDGHTPRISERPIHPLLRTALTRKVKSDRTRPVLRRIRGRVSKGMICCNPRRAALCTLTALPPISLSDTDLLSLSVPRCTFTRSPSLSPNPRGACRTTCTWARPALSHIQIAPPELDSSFLRDNMSVILSRALERVSPDISRMAGAQVPSSITTTAVPSLEGSLLSLPPTPGPITPIKGVFHNMQAGIRPKVEEGTTPEGNHNLMRSEGTTCS